MMKQTPTFADLIKNPGHLDRAFRLLGQLEQLRFITDAYPQGVDLMRSETSENAVADLRTMQAVPVPALSGFIPYANDAFILTKTSSSATGNATALAQAYAAAKKLTPNGLVLSASNRACVIVTPGQYDFATEEFLLDAQYVDIIGLSPTRESQYITSQKTIAATGTIRQAADDVMLCNLWVTIAGSETADCSAYYPTSAFALTRMLNCRFGPTVPVFNSYGAMRLVATYSGYFENVLCEGAGWGLGAGSVFSGTAINCTNLSEGGFGTTGVCSGTLINCHSDVRYGFGGQGGTFSGLAMNCTAGNGSFGGSNGGAGTFSGKAYLCKAGQGSFGTGVGTTITSAARAIACTMDTTTWGTHPSAGAIFVACIDGNGIYNFGTGGFTDPMTTAGDMIIRDASNATARLAIGAAAGYRMEVSSALIPSWTAPTHFEPLTDPGVSEILFVGGDLIMIPGIAG